MLVFGEFYYEIVEDKMKKSELDTLFEIDKNVRLNSRTQADSKKSPRSSRYFLLPVIRGVYADNMEDVNNYDNG